MSSFANIQSEHSHSITSFDCNCATYMAITCMLYFYLRKHNHANNFFIWLTVLNKFTLEWMLNYVMFWPVNHLYLLLFTYRGWVGVGLGGGIWIRSILVCIFQHLLQSWSLDYLKINLIIPQSVLLKCHPC